MRKITFCNYINFKHYKNVSQNRMKRTLALLTLISLSLLISAFLLHEDNNELRWTIIPIDNSKKIFEQCSRSSPKYTRIIQFKDSCYFNAISKLMTKKDILSDKAGIKLENYTLQLVGFNRKNRKLIYFNANSTDIDFENEWHWKENPIILCDSDKASWGIVYDIESDHFVDFVTNGPRIMIIEEL
jgi:hypothetical protein